MLLNFTRSIFVLLSLPMIVSAMKQVIKFIVVKSIAFNSLSTSLIIG